MHIFKLAYFKKQINKQKYRDTWRSLAACSGKEKSIKWDPCTVAVRLQSAFFFGQGKNISPALKLSPRQTNHQNRNKQTLSRLCAHWIHIHNGILKSIQWNASEVTGTNVKTSAGDSSRTKADWPQFSAQTAMTVQDSLPAQSNTADDRVDYLSSEWMPPEVHDANMCYMNSCNMEEDLIPAFSTLLSAIWLHIPMGQSSSCSKDSAQAVCRKASMDVWDLLSACYRP